MAPYTQDNRPLHVATPLGKDVLLLERFSGEEGVSMPFHFTLDMLSDKPAVDPKRLLRQPARVTLQLPGGGERIIHGRISRFSQLGRRAGLTAYRAEMVPWFWFLSMSNDCRIFQNQSVTDIVEQLFTEAGFTDFKVKLLKPLAQRTYCVQYRESTLAFVSRLLEEEGVFYFFEHSESSHTLVLTDHVGQILPCPGMSELRMTATASYAMVDDPIVSSVEFDYAAHTGNVTLTSFDYEHPTRGLLATVSGEEPNEFYDYFGGYTEKADGDRYARLQLEQMESEQLTIFGESNCAALTSGYRFNLTEHPVPAANDAYHVLRVRHAASIPNYSAGEQPGGFDYSNSFIAIPHTVAYRPRRVTPRPIIHGTQTAIVTGPAGEEIHVDQLARVKVHFHWDRRGKLDDTSSCWVRVSSEWAGKGYGSIHIPRIGQEVIVDFLEGDPDQPIIIGRVYNGDMAPPCDPGGKGGMISGLRSKTHKGSGYNAMTMDDTPGTEKIEVHAQYNLDAVIENDETRTIKAGTQSVTVKGDASLTVQAGSRTVSVTGGDYDASASDAVVLHGEGAGVQITGDAEGVTIVGTPNVDISGESDAYLTAPSTVVEGTTECGVTSPNVYVDGSTQIVVGSPTIDIGDGDITIHGKTIVLQAGGGTITIDGSGVSITGSQITAAASGTHTIIGAIVSIN